MFLISSPISKKITCEVDKDTTHLSLGYVAKRFKKIASQKKIETFEISFPDIYRTKKSLAFILTQYQSEIFNNEYKKINKSIHLCIAPWDQARLVLAAEYNIIHVSWEQTYFADNSDLKFFSKHMSNTLRAFDRVWACADFVCNAIKDKKINSVTTFPTPICSSLNSCENINKLKKELLKFREYIFCPYLYPHSGKNLAFMSSNNDFMRFIDIIDRKISNKNKIELFITQGNPGDLRKNLFSVLIGFSLFASEFEGEAYLLVKTPPRTKSMILDKEIYANISEYIRWGWWGSKNIFFLPMEIEDNIQEMLYFISDYYLCCPIAEGQNIPLQEAIQCGCYPISPIHTAMSEYLSKDLIAEIPTELVHTNSLKYSGAYLEDYKGYFSDFIDIADACQKAIDTNMKIKKERINILQKEFLKKYTYNYLAQKLEEELSL